MQYKFSELVDIDELQSLSELFTRMTGFATAILDIDGSVLTATGWQDICTMYHRVHPETALLCRESDVHLSSLMRQGEKYCLYQCRNGLVDVAVPIMVGNTMVAKLYSGQFLLEPPDLEFFRKQAARYGFDESLYLDAVKKVPIVAEDQVRTVMDFLCGLAEMIGRMGLANMDLKLANERLLDHQEHLEHQVAERTIDLERVNRQLTEEIGVRRGVEAQLRVALDEKELLLRELNHRVKNNLQVVANLLDFQSLSLSDEKALRIFQDSQDRIKSMALVHDKLRLKQSAMQIDFGDYLDNLSHNLYLSYVVDPAQVSLVVETDVVSMGIDQAISSGLIVNELISNALKHAFPSGSTGTVTVKCHMEADGRVALTVADTGLGMPSDLDIRKTESLGLHLVTMLVKQLQGELAVNCENGGTEFTVTFPGSSS